MKKRILCFGDSNTWGYIAGTGLRRSENERWTGVCQSLLGEEYTLLEDGLNGRTTVYDDPINPYRNGRKALGYALLSQQPLDMVVVMLGTNDYKFTDNTGVANGIDEIVRTVIHADCIFRTDSPIFSRGARVLLLSPVSPLLNPQEAQTIYARNSADTDRLPQLCAEIAKSRGVYFLDTSKYGKVSPVDGVHFDAESHISIGSAVAQTIKSIFEP